MSLPISLRMSWSDEAKVLTGQPGGDSYRKRAMWRSCDCRKQLRSKQGYEVARPIQSSGSCITAPFVISPVQRENQ